MDRLETLRSIAAEASRGEISFPTGAEVALKVKRALDDPDCHLETAARLVQSEPLLAAKTVALANSVAFNPAGREVTDVRTAVNRLGFRTVRSLAAALAARQLAGNPTQPELRALAAQLWEHTCHVAALARVIARRVTRQDPETAFFAGIVHEVGGFYLLSRAAEFPGLLEGDPADWMEHGESDVGRAVLTSLAVPEPVSLAMEELWQGFLALPPKTLGDTLLLADDLAPVESPLHQVRVAGGSAPSAMIDTIIGEETLLGILEESSAEVESLISALRF